MEVFIGKQWMYSVWNTGL